MILSENSKLLFPKYKGKTVKEIVEIDPQYIVWLSENIEGLTIQSEVLQKCNNRIEYLDSLRKKPSYSSRDDYDYDGFDYDRY